MKKQLLLALTLLTCVSGVFAAQAENSKPKNNWKKYVSAGLKFTGATVILSAVATAIILNNNKGARQASAANNKNMKSSAVSLAGFGSSLIALGSVGTLAGLLIASGVYDLTNNDKRLL